MTKLKFFPSSKLPLHRCKISVLIDSEKALLRRIVLPTLERYQNALSPENQQVDAQLLCNWIRKTPIEQIIKYTLHSNDFEKFCKESQVLKPYWIDQLKTLGITVPDKLSVPTNAFDLCRGRWLYRDYLLEHEALNNTAEGRDKLKAYL